ALPDQHVRGVALELPLSGRARFAFYIHIEMNVGIRPIDLGDGAGHRDGLACVVLSSKGVMGEEMRGREEEAARQSTGSLHGSVLKPGYCMSVVDDRCALRKKGSLCQRLMQYAAVHARQRYAGEECQRRRDVGRTGFGWVFSPSDPFAQEEQGNSRIVVVTGAMRRPGAFADQPIWLRDDDYVARSIWIVPVGQSPQKRVAATAGVLDFITCIQRLDSRQGSKRFPKSGDDGGASTKAFHDAGLEIDIEVRK